MLHRTVTPLLLSLAPTCLSLASAALAVQSWTSSDGTETAVPEGSQPVLLSDSPEGRRITLDRLDEVAWSDWQDLTELLTDIHERTGIPALAAAFVRDGAVVDHATVGVARFGSPEPADASARFHLGSVTKSFTALIVGKLVERGVLSWNTKVADVLDGASMHAAYRSVTLEQLLQHRGGFAAYTDGPPPGQPDLAPTRGTPREKRAAFVAHMLSFAPVSTPGETALYSNLGYALAGHIAERATDRSWEELVQELVFAPLEMGSAGFGFPQAPLGHVGTGPEFFPVPLDAYPPMERIAPAGNIHCSVSDLARYALAHLDGLSGKDGLLRSETIKRLHTVDPSWTDMRYAGGWFVRASPAGDPVHSHGGTVGASFAHVSLYPERRTGVVFLTSVSQGLGEAVANQVTQALLERHALRPSGFVAQGGTPRRLSIVEEAPEPSEDERFWRVVGAMSKAINDEDRGAYDKLFAPSYAADSRDSMFDFMAQSVLPMRGGIHAFHAASRVLRLPDSDRTMRTVIFHLENGFPGYFGIALNEAEQLVEFSLFVKGDVCPNGANRRCDAVEKTLSEGL